MTSDLAPPEPHAPFELADQHLHNAIGALSDARALAGNITDPYELWQLIDRMRQDVLIAARDCERELVLLAFGAIEDAGGEITVGAETIEARWDASGYEWDSPLLIDKLIDLIPADTYVDEETGATLPAWDAAGRGFRWAVTCLGGGTRSASWRSGPIDGLDLNIDNYRTRKPNRRVVGVKVPKPSRSGVRTAEAPEAVEGPDTDRSAVSGPPADKVAGLMAALERSVTEARAARDRKVDQA